MARETALQASGPFSDSPRPPPPDEPSAPDERRPATDASATGVVPVLRTSNWAEAGFFEDLLLSHGFEAQLHERDQFDALAGAWRPDLLVLVPESQSPEAIMLLEEQLTGPEGHAAEDEAGGGFGAMERFGQPGGDGGPEAAPPPLWKPLLFALVAGGFAYLAVQSLSIPPAREQPQQRGERQTELLDFLRSTGGAWHWEEAGVERRLQFDRAAGRFVLEEDLDGDGRPERRVEFRPAMPEID